MLIPRLTRELWELDPWAQMRMMEREMENLFSRYEGWEEEFPALNVYIGAEDALVTAELPGFDSKDFDVSVVGRHSDSGRQPAGDDPERRVQVPEGREIQGTVFAHAGASLPRRPRQGGCHV